MQYWGMTLNWNEEYAWQIEGKNDNFSIRFRRRLNGLKGYVHIIASDDQTFSNDSLKKWSYRKKNAPNRRERRTSAISAG